MCGRGSLKLEEAPDPSNTFIAWSKESLEVFSNACKALSEPCVTNVKLGSKQNRSS